MTPNSFLCTPSIKKLSLPPFLSLFFVSRAATIALMQMASAPTTVLRPGYFPTQIESPYLKRPTASPETGACSMTPSPIPFQQDLNPQHSEPDISIFEPVHQYPSTAFPEPPFLPTSYYFPFPTPASSSSQGAVFTPASAFPPPEFGGPPLVTSTSSRQPPMAFDAINGMVSGFRDRGGIPMSSSAAGLSLLGAADPGHARDLVLVTADSEQNATNISSLFGTSAASSEDDDANGEGYVDQQLLLPSPPPLCLRTVVAVSRLPTVFLVWICSVDTPKHGSVDNDHLCRLLSFPGFVIINVFLNFESATLHRICTF